MTIVSIFFLSLRPKFNRSKVVNLKMRKIAFWVLTVLTVFLSACSKDKSIVIFFENDAHCLIEGYPYFAGLRSTVSTDTAYVGLVSSGDYIQGGTIGSISKGEAITSIIRRIGYDAIALGNHEFDYNVDHIINLTGDIDAPVVCSNLVDSAGNNVFDAYRVCQYGKRKVAYVGVTTPNTLHSSPQAFKDINGKQVYDFSRYHLYDVVQKAVDKARKEADYVIVLSHIGEYPDSINIDSHQMIENTHGIDAVLDAHTHSVVEPLYINNDKGRKVLLAQTGTQFQNAGKLVIDRNGRISVELMPLFDGNIEECAIDQNIKHLVDSISHFYANITEMPVGESDFELTIYEKDGSTAVRYKETNAGDIVADAIREFAQTDVAMINGGGIRTVLPAGKLKRGDVIAMCPYDNSVCSFAVTGRELVEILNASIKSLPNLNGNFPQVSGMKFTGVVVGPEKNYVKDVMIMNAKTGNYEPVVMDNEYSMSATTYNVTSEQFACMSGKYREYVDHHITYTDAVISLIHDIYGGKVPEKYATTQGRMRFE